MVVTYGFGRRQPILIGGIALAAALRDKLRGISVRIDGDPGSNASLECYCYAKLFANKRSVVYLNTLCQI